MLWLILVIISITSHPSLAVTCLDEDNHPIDWFIVYKFPEGFNYAFLVPHSGTWRNSSHQIHESGLVKNTFSAMYNLNGSVNSVYAMYNDEKSGTITQSTWFGHMKGAFAFESADKGFWLIHSIPKLSDAVGSYAYPTSGQIFGQHLFCVTLPTTSLNLLVDQLAVSRPWVQDSYVSEGIAQKYPNVTELLNNKNLTHSHRIVQRFSSAQDHLDMIHFSKAVAFGEDLYEDLVAPRLNVSLNVETWQHGSATENEPSICDKAELNVYNVRRVSFPNLGVNFSSYHDHSKWAVSLPSSNSKIKWACLGDINRQYSQFHRGGGTMCVQHDGIWEAFSSIISQVEPCQPKGTTTQWNEL